MKEKSNRVSEVCEKSVEKTTPRTTPRRLDGHNLYSAELAPGPRELQPFDQLQASSDGGYMSLPRGTAHIAL
jgi:hypothetical protein